MAGFLDPNAPSTEAEYVRYIEGDHFGKILFRNFAVSLLRLDEKGIDIQIGKWGDIGSPSAPRADAQVMVGYDWLDVEIKFARINIANKTKGGTEHNWAFGDLLETPSRKRKSYDILFAVGAEILGFEHPRYWKHLEDISMDRASKGVPVTANALPHEPQYLRLCGLYILPFHEIPSNNFRVHLRLIPENHLFPWFAWGWQPDLCQERWRQATTEALKRRRLHTLAQAPSPNHE